MICGIKLKENYSSFQLRFYFSIKYYNTVLTELIAEILKCADIAKNRFDGGRITSCHVFTQVTGYSNQTYLEEKTEANIKYYPNFLL